jgi:hypothetical protein
LYLRKFFLCPHTRNNEKGEEVMETILFANSTHSRGENVTVRMGEKWKNLLRVGDLVLLGGMNHENPTVAQIIFIHSCRLLDIPREMLEKDHDEKCRTFNGLHDELKRVYFGDVCLTTIMTVIGYEILP